MMKRSIDLEKTLKSLDGQNMERINERKVYMLLINFISNRSCTGGSFCATFKMRLIIQRDVAKIPSDLLDEKINVLQYQIS